jgi:hypothetical protein
VHATAYGIDTIWHLDSGSTDHITGALNKLTVHDKYNRCDRVHTADGNGMHISHIGHSVLHAPRSSLHPKILSMFLVLQKTCFPFIDLHLIIMSFLSFTLSSF